MAVTHRTIVGFALGLAVVLSGCSAAPAGEAPEPVATEAEAPAGESSGSLCDIATAEELEALFGVALGAGERITNISEQESGFQVVSPACSWEVDDVIDVKVVYTQGTAFESGALACVEPDPIFGPPTAVDGVAEQAWWSFDDAFDAEGTMWACTANAMIEVRIETAEGTSVEQQAQATALVEKVLAAL